MLGKAFSILSAFDDEHDTLRLVDLSQRSGVPKPSVYRLAQELVALGMLERVDNGYRIGFSVFALSQRVGTASLLRAVGRPVLVDLVAMTRGTAHLAALEGTGMLARLPMGCEAGREAIMSSERPNTEAEIDEAFGALSSDGIIEIRAAHVEAPAASSAFARQTPRAGTEVSMRTRTCADLQRAGRREEPPYRGPSGRGARVLLPRTASRCAKRRTPRSRSSSSCRRSAARSGGRCSGCLSLEEPEPRST